MATRIAPWAFNLCVLGQSNATIPLADTALNGADVLTWKDTTTELVVGRGDLNNTTSNWLGVGWPMALARDVQDRYPVIGRNVVLINTAWPGKAISHFVKSSADAANVPGGTDATSRNNYEITRDYWTAVKREPTHFVILQGENNAGDSQSAYQTPLEAWLDDLVADYPQLVRVVIVKTATGASVGDVTGVRAAQEAVAAARDYVTLVNVDDLTDDATYHDGLHYTAAGCLVIADSIKPYLRQGREAEFP